VSGILTSGRADVGIDILHEAGILEIILPEICRLRDCPQSRRFHPEGNVYLHTLALLGRLQPGCSLTLALAALLHDVGKPARLLFKANGEPTSHGHEIAGPPIAKAILLRMKYPNDVVEIVCDHVRNHMTFFQLAKMRSSKRLKFLGMLTIRELLELHRLDSLSGSGDMSSYEYAKKCLDTTPEQVLHPVRFITGRDLIELGLKPGPIFRTILEDAEMQQLDGTLPTREAALAFAASKL
jgi:poly(A) polymerase